MTWETAADEAAARLQHLTGDDTTLTPADAADLRAVLDENARMREELAAGALWSETAADLLAATVSETCNLDNYGNCATHGVLILGPGGECPHVQARAFLSSSRLHLDAAPQQPARDEPVCMCGRACCAECGRGAAEPCACQKQPARDTTDGAE